VKLWEVVGTGERPTVNEAVGGFSVFLASRISHICASEVSSYVLRPIQVFLEFFRARRAQRGVL
jgi:hypothetical protein